MTDTQPLRVLVVRLSAIGDCLHAVPVVEEIRHQLPDAFIGWVVQGGGLTLLEDHPAVDRFHRFERGLRGLAALGGLRRLRAEMRRQRYDVALDLQGLTKSGLLARLSGAPRVVGFAGADSRELNRWLITEAVPAERGTEHVVDRNLQLLAALGLEVPRTASWHLPAVDLEGTAVDRLLASLDGGLGPAVLSPGTTWPTKVWPRRHFAELAEGLAADGADVVVVWAGAEEEAMADDILSSVSSPRIHKAPPTSLLELRGLIERSSLLVSNDSGPLHLGVALGIPVVGVYGPTSPARNGPYGWDDPARPAAAVTLADLEPKSIGRQEVGSGRLLECQYCWRTACHRGDHACLEQLGANAVLSRARRLLESFPPGGSV